MRVATLLAVVIAAWTAGAARATTFRVENENGTPQLAQATVADIGLTTGTNEAGEVEPASEPGDTVSITRSDVAGPCGAPEGPTGPSYTVPDPEPDFVTIVLPALAMPLTDPALSPEERGLLGRLNEQRAAAGAGPLTGSVALAEAADGYGGVLHGDPSRTDDHCRLAGPEVRAIDRGWPFDDVQELLAGERTATAALETWLGDPGARATLLDAGYGAAGIARVGDLWVALVSRPCGRLLGARCRMTGDTGDPTLIAAPSPPVTPVSPVRARRDPRLRLALVQRTALKLLVRVRLDPAAHGKLIASLHRGKARRRLQSRRRGAGSFELRGGVRRPGRWRLVVRFEGAAGWRDAALKARTLGFTAPRGERARQEGSGRRGVSGLGASGAGAARGERARREGSGRAAAGARAAREERALDRDREPRAAVAAAVRSCRPDAVLRATPARPLCAAARPVQGRHRAAADRLGVDAQR
jgi:uncharacterized protein YkwD